MSSRRRTAWFFFALATACGGPAAKAPSEKPALSPMSASRPDEPFRRKVVVIKDEGLVGDGAPAEASQGTASAAPVAAAEASPQAQPGQSAGCVQARGWTRYSSGYDHLVTLQNGCAKVADCRVSTNVNPTPIRVTLPAGATETVLTYRGSPAYAFTPIVDCVLIP